ncbi:phage holin family protein [Candidatus Saccharibacteria bacterium]|nr:phage holin family protein [Candidatus Saccharibacteria bacterium]
MKKQFLLFLVRWVLNSIVLWVAVRLFDAGYEDVNVTMSVWVFLFAGLIFSVINSILKPITVILSLPAILLTLGLFMLVVNGLMVYISLKLAPGISMSFINSILTGMLLSLVNYIVSAALELRQVSSAREK